VKKENRSNNTQIDMLFVDIKSGALIFFEAKDASDDRIKMIPNGETLEELYNRLEISRQLEKYCNNLRNHEKDIICSYRDYLEIMSNIFDTNIRVEQKLWLYKKPKLFVYGNPTKKGKACLKAIRHHLASDLIESPGAKDLSVEDITKLR
jgi:hypothetical protein